MKIVQSNAISLNGLIAREDGEEDWLPAEGWTEFVNDAHEFSNFIIGRETYELVMELYPDHNFDDVDVPYKVIVTTQSDYPIPEGYTIVHSPEEAKTFLEERNVKTGLLVGGGKLNSSFYAKRLVDEIWLTVNPFILGKGRPFISRSDFEVELRLINVGQLTKDRVQLKYHLGSKV